MNILDCTAGLRELWHTKAQPDTIFVDIRPDRLPTVIADARQLPFADNTFDLIVFDPPHKNTGGTGIFGDLYGHYTHEEIYDLTRRTAEEINRTLKPTGTACVKVATQAIKLKTWIEHLAPLTIRFGCQVKANRRGQTFWLTATKNPDAPTPETLRQPTDEWLAATESRRNRREAAEPHEL